MNNYASVLPESLQHGRALKLNLTSSNPKLVNFDFNNINKFIEFIDSSLHEANAVIGVGGYGENRVMYQHSQLFTPEQGEARSVHLAVDLWVPAGTPVFSPSDGIIHNFQDNLGLGNYGSTIILEHVSKESKFYTLFGHLSKSSLKNLTVGQKIQHGQQIATIGDQNENGQWPPHLHFQVITDMLGNKGDFPGVCKPSEKDYWLSICPDPNSILNIESLKK
jgi:murein DD-endopeptidase MepM/ murein hydrolase activator NlpD